MKLKSPSSNSIASSQKSLYDTSLHYYYIPIFVRTSKNCAHAVLTTPPSKAIPACVTETVPASGCQSSHSMGGALLHMRSSAPMEAVSKHFSSLAPCRGLGPELQWMTAFTSSADDKFYCNSCPYCKLLSCT